MPVFGKYKRRNESVFFVTDRQRAGELRILGSWIPMKISYLVLFDFVDHRDVIFPSFHFAAKQKKII